MKAVVCNRCGHLNCDGNNMVCSERTAKLIKQLKENLKQVKPNLVHLPEELRKYLKKEDMVEVDNTMELIRPVLLNNYFTEQEGLIFTNGKCKIEIDLKEEIYNVHYRDKGYGKCTVFSDNLNLYWLFGFLAAKDLINRNFKI